MIGAGVWTLGTILVALVLVSQGVTGLYLSHIHAETQNRPLYIVDRQHSHGFDNSLS